MKPKKKAAPHHTIGNIDRRARVFWGCEQKDVTQPGVRVTAAIVDEVTPAGASTGLAMLQIGEYRESEKDKRKPLDRAIHLVLSPATARKMADALQRWAAEREKAETERTKVLS